MKRDYESALAAEVDRQLKGLPDLQAPRHLIPRVLAAIERRAPMPWHRQAWQAWPLPLRLAALAMLVGIFGGVSLLVWRLPQFEGVAEPMRAAGGWLAGLTTIWNALNAVLGALVLAIRQLSPVTLIACGAALAFGYAMCVGVGTMCVRLAWARR